MGVHFHQFGYLRRIIIVSLIFLPVIILFFFYHSAKPGLLEYASAALYQITYQTANDVIQDSLKEQSELVTVEYNTSGEIIALKTNARQLNQIKTQTVSNLICLLRSEENREISIPIGSITGSLFLSGRGPNIHLSVLPVSTIEAEYRNEFFDAGINQTLHKLMMHLKIHTGMLYAAKVLKETVEIDLCLAETVLIGKTPQFFAGIE